MCIDKLSGGWWPVCENPISTDRWYHMIGFKKKKSTAKIRRNKYDSRLIRSPSMSFYWAYNKEIRAFNKTQFKTYNVLQTMDYNLKEKKHLHYLITTTSFDLQVIFGQYNQIEFHGDETILTYRWFLRSCSMDVMWFLKLYVSWNASKLAFKKKKIRFQIVYLPFISSVLIGLTPVCLMEQNTDRVTEEMII